MKEVHNDVGARVSLVLPAGLHSKAPLPCVVLPNGLRRFGTPTSPASEALTLA